MLKIQQLSFWERQFYFEDIDFLVIGSGIVGSSTAYHLRLRYPDAKIVLLERGYLPSGASTKNAGFACFGSPTELIEDLQNMTSLEVWETVSQRYEGLQYLQELLGSDAIGFEHHGSWDIITHKETEIAANVREQLPALNQELHRITGHKAVFREDKDATQRFGFRGVETSFHNCMEGQVHTALLMQRYHELLAKHGILTLYGIDVKDIHADAAQVETEIGFISAKHIFLTVNGFAGKGSSTGYLSCFRIKIKGYISLSGGLLLLPQYRKSYSVGRWSKFRQARRNNHRTSHNRTDSKCVAYTFE